MNTGASKIVMTLVVVFFLIMFGAKVYTSTKDQVSTEEALTYTVNENIVFDGVFVRNEEVITYNGDGVIEYTYPDGSKLSHTSVIANVYDSENQIYAEKRVAELQAEILDLQRSQNPGTTNYAKPEAIKSQIDEKYVLLANQLERGDLESIRKTKNEITMLMNIYNVVTQSETDYNARIEELNKQIEEYKAQCGEPKTSISTDHTGYFVSKTDGYESVISVDKLDSIDADTIEKIVDGKDASKNENAIGKILDDYSCKIVGVIKPTTKFLKGDSLKVRFGTSKTTYDVSVDDIRKIDNEKSIVILNCEEMDEKISSDRVEKVELIFQEFTGLKVPRDAIRFRNIEEEITDENGYTQKVTNEYKGVYVQIGQDIKFKKLDVIYEGDDFVISEDKADTDFLNLYDQIVMEEVKEKDVSD